MWIGKDGSRENTDMIPWPVNPDTCGPDVLESYIKGGYEFTAKLNHEMYDQNVGRNVLVSGSSLLYLLGQLSLGASKHVLHKLLNILHLSLEEFLCILPLIQTNIAIGLPYARLDTISNIVADNSCTYTRDFTYLIEKIFNVEPLRLDLSATLSASVISNAVASGTNGGILDFVNRDVLSSLDNLVLFDAASFTGQWAKPFNPSQTALTEFLSVNDKIVRKQIMYQSGRFLYTESKHLKSKVVKLQYRNSAFSLVVILPKEKDDGIHHLIKKLESPENILSAIKDLRYENVELYLPIFNVSVSNRLRYPLTKMNLGDIFDPKTSGLVDVVNCPSPVVSDVLQRVSLSVNEYGSGSVSNNRGPVVDNGSSRNRKLFRANHSFAYAVYYRDIILIAGLLVA